MLASRSITIGERRKIIVNHPQKDNRPGAAQGVRLLVWLLLGSGCLAAPEAHRTSQAHPGGDFVFGITGPDPAVYADRLPPCEGLGSPLFECTPRDRTRPE